MQTRADVAKCFSIDLILYLYLMKFFCNDNLLGINHEHYVLAMFVNVSSSIHPTLCFHTITYAPLKQII